MSLDFFLVVHNFILSFGSGYVFVMMLLALIKDSAHMDVLCGFPPDDTEFWFWCKVFYWSKYYEYLDTVFLVLRKKQLIFLHVIHHAVVAPLFWMFFEVAFTFHWLQALTNMFVHFFMYYYYMYSALPKGVQNILPPVGWKKHLTTMQIVQFISDLAVTTYILMYIPRCTARFDDVLNTHPEGMMVIMFGYFIGFLFLVLFMNFFYQTYIVKKPKKSSRAPAKSASAKEEKKRK